MSIHGYVGNIITANPTAPTSSVATGVWTTEQQLQAVAAGNWPMALTQISRSLRFNSADSAYLTRTPASAGNRKTWTWSGWVKRGTLGSAQVLLSSDVGTSNTTWLEFGFDSGDTFTITSYTTDTNTTSAVFRDPSAWYHIVVAFDTTQATAANRCKIYVNGTQQTLTGSGFTLNADYGINNNQIHDIGRRNWASGVGRYLDGYLTEINFIDGQALTPSSFGFNSSDTGVWSPKQYIGSYGTNGFYLNFSDNSNTTAATLGKDYSGNGNNWTPNNFSVTAGAGNDSLVDSPTSYGTDTGVGGEVRGNYCTLNPLDKDATITFSNGNLDSVGYNAGGAASFGLTAGKWYWEVTLVDAYATNNWGLHGVSSGKPNSYVSGYTGYPTGAGVWTVTSGGSGGTWASGSLVSSLATWANSDVIGFAFDADALTLDVYRNNVKIGSTLTVPAGAIYPSVYQNGTSGDTSATTYNFGQRAFAYTAPSGFKALCTQNLPTPTIGATSTTQANDYMNVVLYTGNTPSTNAITGVGFAPDFVWVKSRTVAESHNLVDKVRGNNLRLRSNETTAEASATFTLDSDGFTVGANSESNNGSMVGWAWKANGAGSSNTAGTITSTVSANTTSGFSIVTYTGNATSGATVGHGLGVTPSMFIVKSRSLAESWPVYHISLGATKLVRLQATSAEETISTAWNNTAPTSTVFSLGSPSGFTNSSGATYVAYCFAPVAGYSAFGSYVGNGSTDGPFVYTGFRPRFVMIKDTTSTGVWWLGDSARATYNVVAASLFPNNSNAESSAYNECDFLSNGFKWRADNANSWPNNVNGNTYIYAAFAENPFKYSLAR